MNDYAFKLTMDLSRVCETSAYEALTLVVPALQRLISKCAAQAVQSRSGTLTFSIRADSFNRVSPTYKSYNTATVNISGFTEDGARAFLNSCQALARDFNQDELEVIVSHKGDVISALIFAEWMPDRRVELVGEDCEYLQFM